MSTFKPSRYQTAIFEWVRAHAAPVKGRCAALIVKAVAGSGKTTTMVHAAELIPAQHLAVSLAFNKSIALTLADRLPRHVQAKTLNSLGFGAVRRAFPGVQIDDKKTRNLLNAYLAGQDDINLNTDDQRTVCQLVAKAKAHALVPAGEDYEGVAATRQAWVDLIDHYSLNIRGDDEDEEARRLDAILTAANAVLRAGLEKTTIIDFDDQMYFVVAFNLACTQYDWIIIDEAQDVSHVQRMMLHKFLRKGGRLIAVGDDRQAIYGFRGSDANSMTAIREEFGADELPLSISYRCSRAVVKKAQTIVSYIEPSDSAPEGSDEDLSGLDSSELTQADMMICRQTAPLITVAYRLLANRVPCHVQGRDIGAGLVSQVRKIAGRNFAVLELDAFRQRLDTWRDREMVRAQKDDDDEEIARIEDRYQCLRAIMNYEGVHTAADIVSEIESLFARTTGVKLSTIHRAKGLEAERVYVLEPGLMPSKYARKEWQQEQERNLMYVAYTRARMNIYSINAADID